MKTDTPTNEANVQDLLNKIDELQKVTDELLKYVSDEGKDDGCACTHLPIQNNDWSSPLIRKPVMYLYNMSGLGMQCSVDFSAIDIADSVPEIRKDGKLVFHLDSDSYVNSKYKYLYYEINAPNGLPKSSTYAFVRNDKNLTSDLGKLGTLCGLYGTELDEFVIYWELELKRLATPYFKCEILTEAKLNKLFPIEIDPVPAFFIRRYVKFVPADKLGKSQVEGLTTKARMGELRVVEWGGMIAETQTIK